MLARRLFGKVLLRSIVFLIYRWISDWNFRCLKLRETVLISLSSLLNTQQAIQCFKLLFQVSKFNVDSVSFKSKDSNWKFRRSSLVEISKFNPEIENLNTSDQFNWCEEWTLRVYYSSPTGPLNHPQCYSSIYSLLIITFIRFISCETFEHQTGLPAYRLKFSDSILG